MVEACGFLKKREKVVEIFLFGTHEYVIVQRIEEADSSKLFVAYKEVNKYKTLNKKAFPEEETVSKHLQQFSSADELRTKYNILSVEKFIDNKSISHPTHSRLSDVMKNKRLLQNKVPRLAVESALKAVYQLVGNFLISLPLNNYMPAMKHIFSVDRRRIFTRKRCNTP